MQRASPPVMDSATNSIRVNTSPTATIACIHQYSNDMKRSHKSSRTSMYKPESPASTVVKRACLQKRRSTV